MPLGGEALVIGPMRNINFPYVVLSRALLHHKMIEDRTHAYRGPLQLDRQADALPHFDMSRRKRLEKVFGRLRKQDHLEPELLDSLTGEVAELIREQPRGD